MKNNSGKFRRTRKNFAQVSNFALQDPNLSLGAKGLYALIESYISIPDFILYKTTLMKVCKEGKDGFQTLWNQLKNAGYLVQYKLVDPNGHFYYEYELLEKPQDETTTSGNSVSGKAVHGETKSGEVGCLNNKQENNTNLNNINLINSVVVNREAFEEKIATDVKRYIEVGIINELSYSICLNNLIVLLNGFSDDEVNAINNLTEGEAFDLFYTYMKLSDAVSNDFGDAPLFVQNKEGYIRGMAKTYCKKQRNVV